MILEDMMKTDTYKMADYVEYINASGIEIDYKENLLKAVVRGYHLNNGCLVIELSI